MEKFRKLLRQPECQLLTLLLGFIWLSWPFISVFEQRRPQIMVIHLFLIWTILIVLLFLISRSIMSGRTDSSEERRRDADD